jgi:hypothetical protein
MKGLLISAFAVASMFVGTSAVTVTPAAAYSPPQCISYNYHKYCLASYYNDSYCIYQYYYHHQYIYCRYGYSGGGGGSGY